MNVSYNWIKQFIHLDWPAEQAGELLTDLGLEVEGITQHESIRGGLKGIVVGKVLSCSQHPNADRLKCTTVDIGQGTPLSIVCGAPNVAEGLMVPVATIGTTLYTPQGEAWVIKKGKIRGEESHGMICAEDELGLGQSHDGILILDQKTIVGTPLSEIYDVGTDEVFEIGLTPNRADAMSHWGVARDLKAGLIQKGITLELITPSNSNFRTVNRSLKIDVTVADQERAPRYAGVSIKGLCVKTSPDWLQNRLKAIGLSPINNVVDITNYVLHDLGQPLHAFDADKIAGNQVRVTTLPAGTEFVTLDGVTRELSDQDLMICDSEKPMCIAGVFGGLHSGVTQETTNIFLESAYFDPVSIRKTAKRHGLSTDASFRFERGIDPNAVEYALMRAALLIIEIAGGEISSDVVDLYPKKINDHQVVLNFDTARRVIGCDLPKETIKSILTSLDIKINNVTETSLGMTIPAFRNDVTREADVIEEILRVYGYNNIPTTTKLNASIANYQKIEDFQVQNRIGQQLAAHGFYEMLNNSLSHPKYSELIQEIDQSQRIALLNPLSQDLSVLRQSMLFGALETVAFNLNRRANALKLFEFGYTYGHDGAYQEAQHLTLALAGKHNEDSWHGPTATTSFFFLKSMVHQLLQSVGIQYTDEAELPQGLWSEGLVINVAHKPLVRYGVVDQKLTKHFSIDTPVLYADFDWDALLSAIATNAILVAPIPKFPQVKRDFALLVDDQVRFADLKQAAFKTERHLLKEVSLFDVYVGKNLPQGKKSYALSFTLQDQNKTLTDKQIDKIMGRLKSTFESEYGATLR